MALDIKEYVGYKAKQVKENKSKKNKGKNKK